MNYRYKHKRGIRRWIERKASQLDWWWHCNGVAFVEGLTFGASVMILAWLLVEAVT